MLQPRVILEALSQKRDLVIGETGDAVRMNQSGMLRKAACRIYYNVKAHRSDPSNRSGTNYRSPEVLCKETAAALPRLLLAECRGGMIMMEKKDGYKGLRTISPWQP